MLADIVYQRDVRASDLPRIKAVIVDADEIKNCFSMIEKTLNLILRSPSDSKFCEFEPLSSAGFRKVKFFSSPGLEKENGARPDMRILYRYDEASNLVQILCVGFRVKIRPRPPEDAYSIAELRDFNF